MEDKKEKKKISPPRRESFSLSEGALWPIFKSCFSLFFSLFSLFFLILRHNKRALSSTLRAHHHHLREKKRAHTQQQQSTTTQTKDRKKCERSSSAEFKNQFV
jgi:hypothetical protein